jgi:hypothetical protein
MFKNNRIRKIIEKYETNRGRRAAKGEKKRRKRKKKEGKRRMLSRETTTKGFTASPNEIDVIYNNK